MRVCWALLRLAGEGFPRDDVDIVAVRGARHRYACLQTDYTRIMHKLEDGLARLHQQARDSGEVDEAQLASGNRGESNAAQEAAAVAAPLVDAPQTPLAIVDGIDPDGAAARSGLHRGDEILAFGQGVFPRCVVRCALCVGQAHRIKYQPRGTFPLFRMTETASLAEVGRIVQDGAGTVIPLRVRRRGEEMDVALEIPSPPRLGVHLAPWKP